MTKTHSSLFSATNNRLTAIFLVIFCVLIAPLTTNGKESDLTPNDPIARGLSQLREITLPDPNDFTFAVFGDNRGSTIVFERLLSQINDDPDILFAVSLGDIISIGTRGRYDFFFSQVRRNLAKPLLFAPGNHELLIGGHKLYRAIVGSSCYSFTFGNACFIIIDDAEGEEMNSVQEEQVKKYLATADGYRETFIFMHVPLYDPPGAGIRHSLSPEDAERYMEVFRGHRITHIFCSHIHGYFQGQWEEMPYTVSGGAGAPLAGSDPVHYFYHYLKVHVKNGVITIETVPVRADKR